MDQKIICNLQSVPTSTNCLSSNTEMILSLVWIMPYVTKASSSYIWTHQKSTFIDVSIVPNFHNICDHSLIHLMFCVIDDLVWWVFLLPHMFTEFCQTKLLLMWYFIIFWPSIPTSWNLMLIDNQKIVVEFLNYYFHSFFYQIQSC